MNRAPGASGGAEEVASGSFQEQQGQPQPQPGVQPPLAQQAQVAFLMTSSVLGTALRI